LSWIIEYQESVRVRECACLERSLSMQAPDTHTQTDTQTKQDTNELDSERH